MRDIYRNFAAACAILLALVYGAVAHTHRGYAQVLPAPLIHLRSSKAVPPSLPPGIEGVKVSVVDSDQRIADLQVLAIVSVIALAVMAAVSMGLGWLIAGRVLRPLRTITTAARDISATNLHRRLALDGPDDEFKELGDTFDGLLGRLERSFHSQRQFVANASHELRTPLARLKTLVQVALADPNATPESLRATHERVLASEQQLEELIDALLSLASSERSPEDREQVDLAALTYDKLFIQKIDYSAGLAFAREEWRQLGEEREGQASSIFSVIGYLLGSSYYVAASSDTNFESIRGAKSYIFSSAAFRFEVPDRTCDKRRRNFKSAALGV